MSNKLKFAYLNHKSRVSSLKRVAALIYLYKFIKNIFILLITCSLLLIVLLFLNESILRLLTYLIQFH